MCIRTFWYFRLYYFSLDIFPTDVAIRWWPWFRPTLPPRNQSLRLFNHPEPPVLGHVFRDGIDWGSIIVLAFDPISSDPTLMSLMGSLGVSTWFFKLQRLGQIYFRSLFAVSVGQDGLVRLLPSVSWLYIIGSNFQRNWSGCLFD